MWNGSGRCIGDHSEFVGYAKEHYGIEVEIDWDMLEWVFIAACVITPIPYIHALC